MSLFEKAKQIANGAETLRDWLGEGGLPVTRELAQSRADVCARCPLNQKGNRLDNVTAEIAREIKKQREVKLNLELMVVNERDLGTCSACGCHLPLKVWVPLHYIKENMPEETMKKLDSKCWVRNEC